MKGKILLMFVFLIAASLVSSCGSETLPSVTFTPEKQTIEQTGTPEPFVIGECDPAAELIEMNNSYNKGVGCGYTDPYFTTAMYCLWVPDGNQLRIGVKDSLSDLVLSVQRDLFEEPNTSGGWISDNIGRYQDEIVTIKNPSGRYYIHVSTKTGMDCMFSNNAIVFTSAALFTLNTEFEGFPSETTPIEEGSQTLVFPSYHQTDNIVVRTGPGSQYPPTEYQIPMEKGAALIGRTVDGNWLLIESGFMQGWVSASEVTVSGSYSLAPIIETAPPPTSTPQPCPKRIAEGIINDKGFKELRTELSDLVAAAEVTGAEDLGPNVRLMEELLEKIDGFAFPPPGSSCTDRIHAALYNFAFWTEQCFSSKYEEYTDKVDNTSNIELSCNQAESDGDALELLIKELEQVINPAPTSTPPDPPQKTSVFTNELYDPNLDIRAFAVVGNRVTLTICFDLPSDRYDWTMGRLYGDVYLDDGTKTAILSGFTLDKMSKNPISNIKVRCDRSNIELPPGFQVEEAVLTVERIAASIPNNIDWDAELLKLERYAPGIVIEPDRNHPGPGYGLIKYPPGMTAQEASYIVDGLFEPVYIGPWSIPIQVDPE